MKSQTYLILVVFVFTLIPLLAFSQETLTITTYYPSPYGSYRELTSHRMKIGTTYSGSGTTVADNNLIVEGSVGIGTPNPAGVLEVMKQNVGGINYFNFRNTDNTNAGSHSAIWVSSGGALGGDAYAVFDITNVKGWSVGVDNSDSDKFKIMASSGGPSFPMTPALTIQTDGNVGIGTASPAAKLDIAGKIKIADGTQGANKVLTSDASGLASWQTSPGVFPITIGKWQNPGNGSYLGQWDYCSLTLVAGVDDDSGEGVGVYPSFVGTWNSAATRPGWWVWVGSDMNQWEIVCIKFGS